MSVLKNAEKGNYVGLWRNVRRNKLAGLAGVRLNVVIRVINYDRNSKRLEACAPLLHSLVNKYLYSTMSRIQRRNIDFLALLGLKFRICKPSRDVARERAT